jgi:hypothetical protein
MFKIRAVHKEKMEELTKTSNISEDTVDDSENKDNLENEDSTKDKSNLSLSSTSSLSTSKNIVINAKSIPANTVRGTSSSNMMRPSNYEGGYETDLY